MTRQLRTIHYSEVQMPRTMSGPCGTNGQVGKSLRCRFSTAQCNACGVQFLSHVCVRSLLGHENTLAWSAAERTGCNVGKQSFQYQGPLNSDVGVSVENRFKMVKTNFVVVSATLLGTQDPRQAFPAVSEEGPQTFLEHVRHCVALLVFICCSHRPNHFATTW